MFMTWFFCWYTVQELTTLAATYLLIKGYGKKIISA
jgi:hypothetical protein